MASVACTYGDCLAPFDTHSGVAMATEEGGIGVQGRDMGCFPTLCGTENAQKTLNCSSMCYTRHGQSNELRAIASGVVFVVFRRENLRFLVLARRSPVDFDVCRQKTATIARASEVRPYLLSTTCRQPVRPIDSGD